MSAEEKLEAIRARIKGEWDNPLLLVLGPLSSTLADILRILDFAEPGSYEDERKRSNA